MVQVAGTLTEGIKLSPGAFKPFAGKLAFLTDRCGIGQQPRVRYAFGSLMSDIALMRAVPLPSGSFHLNLRDRAKVNDRFVIQVQGFLVARFKISHAQALRAAARLVEKVGIRSRAQLQGWYATVLAERIGLSAALNRAYGQILAEHVIADAHLSPLFQAILSVAEHLIADETVTPSFRVVMALDETIEFDDADYLSLIYHQLVAEGIDFGFDVLTPAGGITSWAMNARKGDVTEYTNYGFNSFAKLGDRYLAAGDDGLYELIGDDDTGLPIEARIANGVMELTGSRFTSFKAAYIAMRGKGDVYLKLTAQDGGSTTYKVRLNPMRTARVDIGKGWRARYFTWELITTGQDFDLTSLEFLPLSSKRRV